MSRAQRQVCHDHVANQQETDKLIQSGEKVLANGPEFGPISLTFLLSQQWNAAFGLRV